MNRSQTISLYLSPFLFPGVLKYDYFFSGEVEHILQENSIDFMLQVSNNCLITLDPLKSNQTMNFWNLSNHSIEYSYKLKYCANIRQLSKFQILLSLSGNRLYLFDLLTHEIKELIDKQDCFDTFSDNLIICTLKAEITIINLDTGINDSFECEEYEYITDIKILSINQIVTSHPNGQIRIWNLLTKKNFILGEKRNYCWIENMTLLSPILLLSQFSWGWEIWNLDTSKMQRTSGGKAVKLNDNQIVSILKENIQIIDFTQNIILQTFPNEISSNISKWIILPDERIAFIINDKLILWNLGKIDLKIDKVKNASLLKDGRMVTSWDKNLYIRN